MSIPTAYFLDVGQGDASVVTVPEEESCIVVDCAEASTVTDCLKERDIAIVEAVFVSHSDVDHVGGLETFIANQLERGEVRLVGMNIDSEELRRNKRKRAIIRGLLDTVERADIDIRVRPLTCGAVWRLGSVRVEVLFPQQVDLMKSFVGGNTNDASAVLRVTCSGKRILYTGDLSRNGVGSLLSREGDLQADILKFPHHGAWFEPPEEGKSLDSLVKDVAPLIVVISVGDGNAYGHPDDRTLRMLAESAEVKVAATNLGEDKRGIIPDEQFACDAGGTIAITLRSGTLEAVRIADT